MTSAVTCKCYCQTSRAYFDTIHQKSWDFFGIGFPEKVDT